MDAEAALAESLLATERLDQFQQGAHGENAPNLTKLLDGRTEIHQMAESLLNARRKAELDPVQVVA